VWLVISALALGCSGGAPESSDDDGGRGGDINDGLGKGSGGSGGVGGDIDAGLGMGSGGTGNRYNPTDPVCIGAEPLVVPLTSNGNPVSEVGYREFEATLTSSTEDSAVLETCAAGASEDGCLTLEIQARGLALPISVGTTVDVQFDYGASQFSITETAVALRELGDGTAQGLLLGIEDGLEWPYSRVSYTSRQLDCEFDNTGFCSARMAYELTFTADDNPSSSAILTMGETGRLELDPNSDAQWRVHNIRSMTSGACDALDPMRYYVVRDF